MKSRYKIIGVALLPILTGLGSACFFIIKIAQIKTMEDAIVGGFYMMIYYVLMLFAITLPILVWSLYYICSFIRSCLFQIGVGVLYMLFFLILVIIPWIRL